MSKPNQVEPVVPEVVNPTPAPTPEPTESTIPKHRFDEVYGKMKTMQEELENYKALEAKKAKEALEATQQFETLYKNTATEHEALKANATALEAKATQYETLISSMVATKLEAIPAELHDLIPANMTVTEKLDWINKAEAKGLFGKGTGTLQEPIGGQTNSPHPTPDYTKMSAMEKLTNAFAKK